MVKVSYIFCIINAYFPPNSINYHNSCCVVCNYLIRRGIAKYEAVYFVGDNQTSNRVRVESYKTRNRGAFSGSLAALVFELQWIYSPVTISK